MGIGPLQKPAVGLLSALNLKNAGRFPSELEDALRATFYARDFYLVDLATQLQTSGNLTLANDNLQITGNAATLGTASGFVLDYLSLIVDTNAADTGASYSLAFRRAQDVTPQFVVQSTPAAATATQLAVAFQFRSPGVLLLPGFRLYGQCNIAPAAARAATLLASGYTLP